jgi:hypothetical protein
MGPVLWPIRVYAQLASDRQHEQADRYGNLPTVSQLQLTWAYIAAEAELQHYTLRLQRRHLLTQKLPKLCLPASKAGCAERLSCTQRNPAAGITTLS